MYGGLAAMTAEALTFPIDMSKTRLQIQVKSSGDMKFALSLIVASCSNQFCVQRVVIHDHIFDSHLSRLTFHFTSIFEFLSSSLNISQGQVADARLSALKYRGMIHTLVTVGRQEGVMSLFTGAKFALLRQGTYGTIRLGKFACTRKYLSLVPRFGFKFKKVAVSLSDGELL